MLQTKTEEVPAKSVQVVTSTICDFCGQKIRVRTAGGYSSVTIARYAGQPPEDGGGMQTTLFDCCSACWESKILVAFDALGAKPRTENWEP